jgi:beta-lactamase regulating signal transducer with metallopeptidase domain/5-hydroxyisourate hydrolase-like protein (transthyretin family)
MSGLNQVSLVWSDWMLTAGWQVAVVALAVLILLKIGQRKISSQLQYALLLVVLVKFATPPFLHLSTGLFSQPAVARLSPSNGLGDQLSFIPSNKPAFASDFSETKELVATGKMEQSNSQDLSGNASAKIQLSGNAAISPSPTLASVPWRLCLMIAYCMGVLFFVIRLSREFFRLRRVVAGSELQLVGDLRAELADLANRVGLRSAPELRLSDDADAPFVTGVLRPVVVLPRTLLSKLSADQRRIVVAHELVHVRRWDLVVGWAEVLLSVIWWFHPAMWWCRRSLRQSREDCCDDVLVASQLAQPESYCETLIQAALNQPTATNTAIAIEPLALGFANQEHPAGRRIRRLMDDSIFRADRLRVSAFCTTLLVALIALPGLRQTNATVPQNRTALAPTTQAEATTAGKTPSSESLEKIIGKVVDEQGRPIGGATVRARIYSRTKRWEESKVLSNQNLVTDENGKFEFELSENAKPGREITFFAEVSNEYCFEKLFSEYGLEKSGKLLKLEPYQLTRGMKIKGRIIAPGVGDESPVGITLSASATYQEADGTNEYIYQYLKCDDDGFFTGVVPENSQLTLDVSAKNYASASVKHELKSLGVINKDEIEVRDLGEIKLNQGTSVFGVARHRDGRPAVGVVLGMIEGDDTENPKDVSAAKTDSQGRFRFFPHSGKCMILALKSCRTRESYGPLQRGLTSDPGFPLIGPHFLDLSGKGAELELDLVEAETVTLSGVVRNVEGNPCEGVTVQCGWQTERGLVEVEYASTDDQGRYESRVPKGSVPSLQIRDQLVFGVWYEPFLADANSDSSIDLFTNPNVGLNEKLKFKPALKSVSDLDWVMTKYQNNPSVLKRVGDFLKWWQWGE